MSSNAKVWFVFAKALGLEEFKDRSSAVAEAYRRVQENQASPNKVTQQHEYFVCQAMEVLGPEKPSVRVRITTLVNKEDSK